MPIAVRQSEALLQHVRAIREELGLSQEALAQMLGVSSRSVARWEEGSSGPSPLAAGRLRLLAEIHDKAHRLFKAGKVEAWLRAPNEALGGVSPLDRMRMAGGLEEVRDLLGRIEWGIPT